MYALCALHSRSYLHAGRRSQKFGRRNKSQESKQPAPEVSAASTSATAEGSRDVSRSRHLLSASATVSVAHAAPATLADITYWLCGRGLAEPPAHNNTAMYGHCLAGVYSHLEVTGLPTYESPQFAGVDIKLVVLKKDIYGQTVAADSSSSLQLLSARDRKIGVPDPGILLLGSVFSGFQQGRAEFAIGVKPTFASTSVLTGTTTLLRQPFLYIAGTDFQTNAAMQTPAFKVHIAHGNQSVCPPGSVLALDQAAVGECTRCKPGSYSLSPLVGPAYSTVPGCLNCPAGGNCLQGGNAVAFALGNWSIENGTYLLTSCPLGHKMITSSDVGNSFSHDSGSDGQFSHDSQQCELCGKVNTLFLEVMAFLYV